jgi:tyrosyl-tRNA synthetase
MMSPYRFYQFWINTEDKDVVNCLKRFTLLPVNEIKDLEKSVNSEPEKRNAQRALARAVTLAVHGQDALTKAEEATQVLFGGEISNLTLQDVADIFANVPSVEIEKSSFSGEGVPLVDVVTLSGLAQSKGEAKRLIQNGGIYLNNVRSADVKNIISLSSAIEGQAIVLRKGQRDYRLVKIRG